MEYWSFWTGGIALGLVATGYVVAVRRPFGVSGAVGGLASAIAPGGAGVDLRSREAVLAAPLSVAEQAALVVAIAVGAAISALLAGTWGTPADASLGPAFTSRFGDGLAGWAAIGGGAILVGYGTQWARGCTSGHGLIGVASLQRPSLIATAVFFGTAIAVSVATDALFGGL